MQPDTPQVVEFKVHQEPSELKTLVRLYFKLRLQYRGSDYSVYANNGYTPAEDEAAHLQAVLNRLFDVDGGVNKAIIKPFEIMVYRSLASSVDWLREQVSNALRDAGFEPVDVDEEERRLQEDLRSSRPKPWWRYLWSFRSRKL